MSAQRAIVEGAKDESGAKRSLNEAETANFNTAQSEIEALREELRMAQRYEENLRASAAAAGAPVEDGEAREEKKVIKRYSLHRAIRSQMPNGVLEGAELEMHQEVTKRAKEAGISLSGVGVPSMQKRADGATVTQDSGGFGGNLVAEELGAPIEFLRPRPVLASLGARMLTGLQGNVAFPTNDGGIVATWEGEVDTIDPTKTAYGKREMAPHRLGVTAPISLQNLFQSSSDLEALTVQDINLAVGQAMDAAGINGSGTGNVPMGILNAVGTTAVAAGTNGAAPTWEHIVALETGISSNDAEAANMAYLINAVTKGKLKVTKHEAGDLGYLMATDNTINGYRAGISNLVPANLTKGSGTNLSAGIFGDFTQLLMGQWGFYDLVVDNITRKKDGYVEITLNTFLDMLVRQPKAFAVVKDWVI